ncbi:uncharacterized protein [Rutidosis leptorrhynchoides]|uniref:uncharacterized protein n=1 Tax=Rutidosis leptorrhynchoides TaxID=125765 RepID=UPI003A9A1FA1
MRLRQPNLTPSQKVKVFDFSTWLLNIGNGESGAPYIEDPDNARWMHILDEYCIPDDEDELTNLIAFIYPRASVQNPTASELQQKAIVCPKNDMADSINKIVIDMVDGPVTTYSSSDTATPYRNDGGESEMLYPVEYLNTLNYAGFATSTPPQPIEKLEVQKGPKETTTQRSVRRSLFNLDTDEEATSAKKMREEQQA